MRSAECGVRSVEWGKTGIGDWGLGVSQMRNADCRMRSEKTGLRIQKGGKKGRIQESESRRG